MNRVTFSTCLTVFVGLLLWTQTAAAADADGDGIPDQSDNCVNVYNAFQIDGDGDGFGNACDFDYNNDQKVDAADAALLQAAFGRDIDEEGVPDVFDADEDGLIAGTDWAAFSAAAAGS